MSASRAALLVTALAVFVSPVVGCMKSSTTQASVDSSSDSSSSPFKSSSGSSSGDDDEKTQDDAYRRDVRDYATSFGALGGDARAFQRDLSEIAQAHGIGDWESHRGTYLAIGRGLRQAELDDRRFAQLAVELAHEDFGRLALLRAGFAHDVNGGQ